MNTFSCPSRRQLLEWLAGHLDDVTSEQIVLHTQSCDDCDGLLDELESLESRARWRDVMGAADDRGADDWDADDWGETRLHRDDEPTVIAAAVQGLSNRPPMGTTRRDATTPVDFSNRRLGDYEIGRRIGEGGMGVVYQARQVPLDRPVAIKLIRTPGGASSQVSPDSHIAKRFRREVLATGQLDHPNLIRAFDAGQIDGTAFLAMEFIDGPTPDALLGTGRCLNLWIAAEIIRQAALGLHQAHESGWVHRDVKLSNLIIGRDDAQQACVKVLDLGLASNDATSGQDLTATADFIGTMEYIAPEQRRGTQPVDRRADVYSLGVALVRLLTGHYPPLLPRETPSLPSEIQRLIRDCLADDPETRLADCQTLARKLARHARPFSAMGLVEAVHDETVRHPHSSAEFTRPITKHGGPVPSSAGAVTDRTPWRNFAAIAVTAVVAATLTAIVTPWITARFTTTSGQTIPAPAVVSETPADGVTGVQTPAMHPLVPANRTIEVPVRGRSRDVDIARLYFEASPGPMTLRVLDPQGTYLSSESVELFFYLNGDHPTLDPDTGERITQPHTRVPMPDEPSATFEIETGTSKFSVVPAWAPSIASPRGERAIERTHTLCTFYCYPDLTYQHTRLQRARIYAGGPIELTAEVINAGQLVAPPGRVAVRFGDADDGEPSTIGMIPYDELEPGESQAIDFAWQTPPHIRPGTYSVEIHVDAGETSIERDELRPGDWDTHAGQAFYFIDDPKGKLPSNNRCRLPIQIDATP